MSNGFTLPLPVFAICTTLALSSYGQSPVQSVTGPTQPPAIPLSGQDLPNAPVTIQQRTMPTGSPSGSVDVIDDSVQVQFPFTGGRPEGRASAEVIPLSFSYALTMALKNNLGRLTRDAGVLNAEGARTVARSGLLPDFNFAAAEVFEKENLRTVGIKTNILPEGSTFNYDDARILLQQSVVDLVEVHTLFSATEQLKSAQARARNARDLIVLAVGNGYLELIATQARLTASEARAITAKAIFTRARNQHEAGLAPKIDADRAEVQMETEEQRTISIQADLDVESLRLARMIGLPISQRFVTSESFGFQPELPFTLNSALERASTHREDLVAARSSARAADEAVKAARSERLPSIAIRADAGIAGTTPSQNSIGVYTVQGILTVPIYNGGRISGDEKQAEAARLQRRSELADTQVKVEQDVREAFIRLNAANSQVRVAQHNTELAHETLRRSTDRFKAGVTDTVEVVQAEQAVVQADDDLIAAQYQHNLAKLSLASAMGSAEEVLPQLLKK